jgi:hypothetical protein
LFERLRGYPELLRRRFGKQIGAGESVLKRFPGSLRNLIARMLLKNEKFCRTVVVENWFLRMKDAPLSSYFPAVAHSPDKVAV